MMSICRGTFIALVTSHENPVDWSAARTSSYRVTIVNSHGMESLTSSGPSSRSRSSSA